MPVPLLSVTPFSVEKVSQGLQKPAYTWLAKEFLAAFRHSRCHTIFKEEAKLLKVMFTRTFLGKKGALY